MSSLRRIPGTVALALMIALAGCGSETGAPSAGTTTVADTETTTTTVDFLDLEELDPAQFSDPTTIDNRFLPLEPGTRLVYDGATIDDGESIPHRIVHTVTDLTKVVNGVRTVVVWDQDFEDGSLVEAELAFFAQADDGTVWHLGEYPEEYEEGEFVKAPGWIAGVDGALAGIQMQPDPQPGTPSYSQGWGPAVDWTDRGQVYAVGEKTCVRAGCFDDVLIVDEFSRSEPNSFQQKYYAPGVGGVRVGFRGDDPTKENLELVAIRRLGPAALATARKRALALEASGYRRLPNVYGTTEPAVSDR